MAEACFSTKQSSVYKIETLCPNGEDVDTTAGSGINCPETISGCDHGTHVAGIAVGASGVYGGVRKSGVAPESNLIPIQVFTKFDDVRVCGLGQTPCIRSFASDQIRALEYVIALEKSHKIASVNMSLGGGRHETHCDEEPLSTQIGSLRGLGISTVIASGNNGFFNAVSSPGCISDAITVTASTKDFPPEVDTRYANVSGMVDFIAPGTDINSAVIASEFAKKTGTSMAAPHVAGAIAVIKATTDDVSVAVVEQALSVGSSTIADPRTGLPLQLINIAKSMEIFEKAFTDQASTVSAVESGSGNKMTAEEIAAVLREQKRIIVTVFPNPGKTTAEALGQAFQSFGTSVENVKPIGPAGFSAEFRSDVTAEDKATIAKRIASGEFRVSPDSLSNIQGLSK